MKTISRLLKISALLIAATFLSGGPSAQADLQTSGSLKSDSVPVMHQSLRDGVQMAQVPRPPGGPPGPNSCIVKWNKCMNACNTKHVPESNAANACYGQCNTKHNNGNDPC